MILQITILTLITIAFVVLRSYLDDYSIKVGYKINHTLNATYSIVFGLSISQLIIGNWSYLPIYLSIYWLFFDMLLNKLRGKELLFVGTTAWLDRSFRKIAPKDPGVIMLIAKTICLGISVWVFIKFN